MKNDDFLMNSPALKDKPVKVYRDGSKGNYMCNCYLCGQVFIGVKRDIVCPDCDCEIYMVNE